MAKNTPIDWVKDVCYLINSMATSFENKIYTVGGTLYTGSTPDDSAMSDSYLRIVDFSKPVGSGKTSIDISTDNITTAIRLPDNVPRLEGAALLISNGVMHMFPGTHALFNSDDAYGNILNITTYRTDLTDKVWDFDLKSHQWSVHDSGLEDRSQHPAVAYDAKKQVGWYYGGFDTPDRYYNGNLFVGFPSNGTTRALQDLYRLDQGKENPTRIETDSTFVGNVEEGELVYIEGAGGAGVLVLIGGNAGAQSTQLRSMQTVHVFDIATSTWFAQSTTAQSGFYPDGRIGFCSVVASAPDNSSHNIYIYGGLDSSGASGRNEVFILTLPAFHWVSVYPSAKDKSDLDIRKIYDHRCQKVQEKHMVAYRGNNVENRCDSDQGLKKYQGMAIYDMSSLTWTTKVQLENPKYLIPQVLYGIIGGGETGNANITQPRGGFQDPNLAHVFASRVSSNKTTLVTATALPQDDLLQSNVPIGAIAGGVVGCLVLLIAVLYLLKRRRQRMKASQQPPEMSSESMTDKSQNLQERAVYELQQDSKKVFELQQNRNSENFFELPAPPMELEGSLPEKPIK